MLFPENPSKNLSLWTSLKERLRTDQYCFFVKQGAGNVGAEAQASDESSVAATVARLQDADICRLGASRGVAVAPHFGLRVHESNGPVADLCELIGLPSEGASTASLAKLQRDLETMTVSVFHDFPGISAIRIPLDMSPWKMPDAKIVPIEQGLLITRA